MERDVNEKSVVVTGGASGIGYTIAENFLINGAKIVILLDINEKEGVNAVATLTTKYGENKAVFYKCDVTTDLQNVSENLLETYKTIDVLVNNAGVVREKTPEIAININLTAVIEWSFKFFNHMRKDKGGKAGTIINISSGYGFMIAPYVPVYQATKHGVIGFTKSLGHKSTYDKTGVRIFALCPGFTESNLVTDATFFDKELVFEDYKKHTASIQFQKPEVVGAAAVESFKRADSGTVWMIDNGEPVTEVVMKRA